MSLVARLLSILQAAGPEGIKTDALAKLSGAKPLVLNNYLRRYRAAGVEIHTLRGNQSPGTLYTRREWFDAAKTARTAEVAARHKAQVLARSKAQSDLAAWRKATAAAAADAKAALLKPPRQERATPAQHVGPLPDPHVLPSQPAYSRHQLAALPAGFQSPLDPAECRPWAIAASGGVK